MDRFSNATAHVFRAQRPAIILAGLMMTLAACASPGGPQRGGGPGGPGGGQANMPRIMVDPASLFFLGMDMDDDLVVTREEFEDRAPIQFLRADTNADEQLRPLELSAWVAEVIGTRDAPYGMGSFDRIGDGMVTEAEFVGFLRLRFESLDKNKDGRLERSEVVRSIDPAVARQQGGQRGGPQGGGRRR